MPPIRFSREVPPSENDGKASKKPGLSAFRVGWSRVLVRVIRREVEPLFFFVRESRESGFSPTTATDGKEEQEEVVQN